MAKVQKKKESKKENKIVEPDYSAILDCGAVLNIYEHDEENITCKLTLYDAFVIFGRIVKYGDGAFISYPSYYSKSKKKYVNQAYCFDNKVNDEVADFLAAIYGK